MAQGYRKALAKVLEKGEPLGDFAVGGVWTEAPAVPGLNVAGLGVIGLPLMPIVAQALAQVIDLRLVTAASTDHISQRRRYPDLSRAASSLHPKTQRAQPAPFGKGNETLVDEQVRKTLQVDSADVTLTNPAWQQHLSKLVAVVAKGMGCDASVVVANLYKLLLYEPGGHFRAHRDTEKEPGMFGTLVIQLPTAFEGGAITVRHQGETKVFDFSGSASMFRFTYTAFFSDCEHQISPVTSGHRLALTYNLVCPREGGLCRPPGEGDEAQRLVEAVKLWESQPVGSKALFHVHVLEHQASLCLYGLKNNDGAIGRTLAAAAERGILVAYLAKLKRSESSYDTGGVRCYSRYGDEEINYENGDWEINLDSTTLSRFVDTLDQHAFSAEGGEDAEEEDADDAFDEDDEDDDDDDDDEDDDDGFEDDAQEVGNKGVAAAELPVDKIDVDSDDFLPGDVEDALGDPDDETFEGYLGNESATRERTYHRSAIIFWPASHHVHVMLDLGAEEYSFSKLAAAMDEKGQVPPEALPHRVKSAKHWYEALGGAQQAKGPVPRGQLASSNAAMNLKGKHLVASIKVGVRVGADPSSLIKQLDQLDVVAQRGPLLTEALTLLCRSVGPEVLLTSLRSAFARHSSTQTAPYSYAYHAHTQNHARDALNKLEAIECVVAVHPALGVLKTELLPSVMEKILTQSLSLDQKGLVQAIETLTPIAPPEDLRSWLDVVAVQPPQTLTSLLSLLAARVGSESLLPLLNSSFTRSKDSHTGRSILTCGEHLMREWPATEILRPVVQASAVTAYLRTAPSLHGKDLADAIIATSSMGKREDVGSILRSFDPFCSSPADLQELLKAASTAFGSYSAVVAHVEHAFSSRVTSHPPAKVISLIKTISNSSAALAPLGEKLTATLVRSFFDGKFYLAPQQGGRGGGAGMYTGYGRYDHGHQQPEPIYKRTAVAFVDLYTSLLTEQKIDKAHILVTRVANVESPTFPREFLLAVIERLRVVRGPPVCAHLDHLVLSTISRCSDLLQADPARITSVVWAAYKAHLPAETITSCLRPLNAIDPLSKGFRTTIKQLQEGVPVVLSHQPSLKS